MPRLEPNFGEFASRLDVFLAQIKEDKPTTVLEVIDMLLETEMYYGFLNTTAIINKAVGQGDKNTPEFMMLIAGMNEASNMLFEIVKQSYSHHVGETKALVEKTEEQKPN